MNSGGKRRGHVSTSFQALVRKRGNIEIEGCVNAVLWYYELVACMFQGLVFGLVFL